MFALLVYLRVIPCAVVIEAVCPASRVVDFVLLLEPLTLLDLPAAADAVTLLEVEATIPKSEPFHPRYCRRPAVNPV